LLDWITRQPVMSLPSMTVGSVIFTGPVYGVSVTPVCRQPVLPAVGQPSGVASGSDVAASPVPGVPPLAARSTGPPLRSPPSSSSVTRYRPPTATRSTRTAAAYPRGSLQRGSLRRLACLPPDPVVIIPPDDRLGRVYWRTAHPARERRARMWPQLSEG